MISLFKLLFLLDCPKEDDIIKVEECTKCPYLVDMDGTSLSCSFKEYD